MEQKINQNTPKKEEISIKELIQIGKDWWKFLLTKWKIICIFGFGGAAIGLGASFYLKPKYTAHLSFALIESSGGLGGLADLASTFGFAGLGGSNDAFSGDNLLEIIASKYAVERTLLSPVEYNGENITLAQVYLKNSGMANKFSKDSKYPELQTLSYPIGQERETFTRVQDSVLNMIYLSVSSPKVLSIARKNKKVSIVNVNFTSKNEKFAKLFVEKLLEETYNLYRLNKTMQARSNIDMLQHTADSIKALYDASLFKGASISGVNVNLAMQKAAVPRLQQETNAQLYGTVYTEVLKNMETLKLDMARKTPLVQMIDTPRYPLYKTRLGKLKGLVIGGFLGGLLIVSYLLFVKYIKDLINSK